MSVERENLTIGVAAIVYWQGQVLIGKRAAGKKICPGLWQFPGGHVDPGETIDRTAVREVLEETGLEVRIPIYDGEKPPYLFVTDQRPIRSHLTFWVPAEPTGGFLKNVEPEACDGWYWIKPEEIPDFVADVYTMPQLSWLPLDLLYKHPFPGSPFGAKYVSQVEELVASE